MLNDGKKSKNLQLRVDADIKERVEIILKKLGITSSQAVNMFFMQVINHNGIPFDLKLEYDPVPLSEEEEEGIKNSINKKGDIVDPSIPGELEKYLNNL